MKQPRDKMISFGLAAGSFHTYNSIQLLPGLYPREFLFSVPFFLAVNSLPVNKRMKQ